MRPDLIERGTALAQGGARELQYFGFGVFTVSATGEGEASVTSPGLKMWLRHLVLDFDSPATNPSNLPDLRVTLRLGDVESTPVQLEPHRDRVLLGGLSWSCPNLDLVLGATPVELVITGGPINVVGTAALIADVLDVGRLLKRDLALNPNKPRVRLRPTALYAALDAKRNSVGLSWREVGTALNVSPSTFTRMSVDETPSADALVTMLAWLDWPNLQSFTSTG